MHDWGFGSSLHSHWLKNNTHQPPFKTTITKTWMDMNESVFFFFISFLLKIKLSCCGKWTNEDNISKPVMNDRKSNCIKTWLWKTRTQAKLHFYAFKFTMQVMGIPATIVHNRPLTSNSSHADHGTNGFERSSVSNGYGEDFLHMWRGTLQALRNELREPELVSKWLEIFHYAENSVTSRVN